MLGKKIVRLQTVFVVLGKKIEGKGLGRSQQVITNKGNKGKKISLSFASVWLL